MPWATLTRDERALALDLIDRAGGPEGATVDLERSLAVRRVALRGAREGRAPTEAELDQALRLACELVVRTLPVEAEPVVRAWAQALGASRVPGRVGPPSGCRCAAGPCGCIPVYPPCTICGRLVEPGDMYRRKMSGQVAHDVCVDLVEQGKNPSEAVA